MSSIAQAPPNYSNQQGMPQQQPAMFSRMPQQGAPGGGFFGSAPQSMGVQWGQAPAGSAQQQMMQTQGMPPPGAPPPQMQPTQYRPPQGQFRAPGMAPPPGAQGAPQQSGMAPPPGMPGRAPPPGGPEQDQMYRQMLMNKGGPAMAKDGYNRAGRNAQMAYAEKFGTGYDPRGKMSWMANPSKKDRRAMAKINALRAAGSGNAKGFGSGTLSRTVGALLASRRNDSSSTPLDPRRRRKGGGR